METDQEELVTMIFGDSPPENWRENPEFCLYLSEIGGLSADRVAGETDRVSGDLKTLQQQTQDLAIDNSHLKFHQTVSKGLITKYYRFTIFAIKTKSPITFWH